MGKSWRCVHRESNPGLWVSSPACWPLHYELRTESQLTMSWHTSLRCLLFTLLQQWNHSNVFTTTRPSLAHTELEWEVLRCLPSVWVRATRAEFPLREVTTRWPPRRDGEKLAVCSPGIEPGSLSIQPSVLTTALWTPHREPAHNELTQFSALSQMS